MHEPRDLAGELDALGEALCTAALESGADVPAILGQLERVRVRLLAQFLGRPQERPAAPAADALTVSAVAARLQVPEQHVYTLIRSGDLPAFRCGKKYLRVDPADLARWQAAQRIPPPSAPRRLPRAARCGT